MCGRISQKGKREEFKDFVYEFDPQQDLFRGNIKPTQGVSVVLSRDGKTKTADARWWFQRQGSNAFETKYTTFNARADKLENSSLFSKAFERQRCLVPVSSFYEWNEKGKPPIEIFANGNHPFALAGLWSHWFDGDEPKYSFTIITTEPNDFMKAIHTRMPVILRSIDDQKKWLEEGGSELLIPFKDEMNGNKLSESLEKIYSS